MMGDLDRKFLFDVRPMHRETLDSYTSRLLVANFETEAHHRSLVAQAKAKATVATTSRDEIWQAVIVAKTKRHDLYLDADPAPSIQHRDGGTCDTCTADLPNRWMCSLCAGGAKVWQHPHFDDLVCVRHRRWVGLTTPVDEQQTVDESVVAAAVQFRKLRRAGRLDLRLFRVLTDAVLPTGPTDTGHEARAFATVVGLAGAITAPGFSRGFFNPKTLFADSHELLAREVATVMGTDSPELTRVLWLYARPTAWAIRDAIITKRPFTLAWSHDLPIDPAVVAGFDLAIMPDEPFKSYLDVTCDGELTAARHGLTSESARLLRQSGVSRTVLAICTAGHQFQTPAKHLGKAASCPMCSHRVFARGYTDLQSTHPALATEFDTSRNGGMTAQDVTHVALEKYYWLCASGHSFQMAPAVRSYSRGNCYICSNRVIVPGINDVGTTHPQLVVEWHPEYLAAKPPTRYSAGSKALIRWICPKGHDYMMHLWERVGGKGCQECDRYKSRSGRANLQLTHPELASEWHPTFNRGAWPVAQLSPADFSSGSRETVYWLCPFGHHYQQRIERRVAGYNCSVCSRRTLVPNVNDLATTEPLLVREWHPYLNTKSPSKIFAGTDKYWWRCKSAQHNYEQSVPHRIKSKGCPQCVMDLRILSA